MALQLPIRFVFLMLLSSLTGAPGLNDCHCNHPKGGEITHRVGNIVTVFVKKNPYRTLRGVITGPDGKPFADALVEILTKPDYLLSESTYASPPGQQRIVACRTRVDGKFCFSHLASGKYELRCSSDRAEGWNVVQVYVVVDRDKGIRKQLQLTMTLGQ